MRVRAASVVLPVPADEAFEFLSRLENLPLWATEFITGNFDIRGDHAVAETQAGRMKITLRADRTTGVIDHADELESGEQVVFPTRVHPVPGRGRSLFVFTAIQRPEQPDEAFAADLESLDRELRGLADLLEGRSA